MVGSPDSVQKNVVLENNSLSAEQITGVENRKSKAGEAVLPVLRLIRLFLLGLLGVLLILLTLLVIAAEAARIICLGQAAKKQQQPMQNSPADFRRSSQANIRVSAI